ncbi:MAG: 6-bladed beta-propeller [Gemmatimonas sp.]
MMFRRLAILYVLASATVHGQTVRDSAGVRIVSYAQSATAKTNWQIVVKALIEIGGASGVGPTELTDVWGVARTATGGVVLSDGATQQLRVFDANGRYVRTMGRKGDGPGEFTQIRHVAIHGDTVIGLDDTRGTAAFAMDGKLLRQAPFPSLSPYHAVDPWGVMADGRTIEGAAPRETMAMLQQVGTRIQMRGLFAIASNGRSAKLLDSFPTYEYYRAASDPPGGDDVAFAPTGSVAVFGTRICVGRGVRYEVRCMNAAGVTQQIIRRDVAAVPVTEAARDAHRKGRSMLPAGNQEGHNVSQATLDQLAAKTRFATNFPAYARILAGKNDELWVSDYSYDSAMRGPGKQPTPKEVLHWNVFARDGDWIGSIDLPARFVLMEAGRDYVLGINRDEDGVERVTMYRMTRN